VLVILPSFPPCCENFGVVIGEEKKKREGKKEKATRSPRCPRRFFFSFPFLEVAERQAQKEKGGRWGGREKPVGGVGARLFFAVRFLVDLTAGWEGKKRKKKGRGGGGRGGKGSRLLALTLYLFYLPTTRFCWWRSWEKKKKKRKGGGGGEVVLGDGSRLRPFIVDV